MCIIGMTDDRELLKFMPPIPKIRGSVMRALIALSGLPMGSSLLTGDDFDPSNGNWMMWVSTLIMVVFGFTMLWMMAPSNSGGS